MSSYVPPVKNGASGWIGYISLAPYTANGRWVSNPTLASGDVKISIDGGAFNNLGTLPAVTPGSSKSVKITLSQAETNGDNLIIVFSDQTEPPEWTDTTLDLQTAARSIDDLAFPNTTGRGMDVTAGGAVGIDWGNVENPSTANNLSATSVATAAAVTTVNGLAANVITTASINDGAFTAAKFASGAFDAVWSVAARTLTAGTNIQLPANGLANITAWTVNLTGNLSGSVGSVTGLDPARLDVAVSTRLAAADYTAPDNAGIVGIKAKTDSLTFTVSGNLDSNITYVNGIAVQGSGTGGDPWGPV